MSLDLSAIGREVVLGDISWTSKDALLYALGVGAGSAGPGVDTEFITENSHDVQQQVLPTYGVLLAPGGPVEVLGDIDRTQLLHAGQTFELAGPLPVEGTVRVTNWVSNIFDKGKGALVERESVAVDVVSGKQLIRNTGSIYLRGEGGFGGDPGPPASWERPERAPDDVVTMRTKPEQALIYRLSGDRNPLHSDVWFARRGGFDRPILHGLCTFGFAGRALLSAACAGRVEGFRGMGGRFVRPVFPGDTLTVNIWRGPSGQRAQFQVAAADGALVIDHGTLAIEASTNA